MSASLTGKDTILLGQNNTLTPLVDFATGDVAILNFPNKIVEMKTGKNQNTIYAFNATGNQVECELRLLRGSPDDKRLNSMYAQYLADPAAFSLISAQFVKRLGDGASNITSETYSVSGGIISERVAYKENVEGDVDQAVAVYKIAFSNNTRTL